jgi:hypothetical protein
MTKQNQIKALVKFDGWRQHPKYIDVMINKKNTREAHLQSDSLTRYLHSYDAIIPLIQRQCTDKNTWCKFLNQLSCLVQNYDGLTLIGVFNLYKATPTQLCDALLRATGKWKRR